MLTLYQQINNLTLADNIEEVFHSLHLDDGFELLKKVSVENICQINIAKYCSKIYDPESKLIEVHKNIDEIKIKIINELGVGNEQLFIECVENKNAAFEKYVDWYYGQIKDFEYEAIRTGEQLVAREFSKARAAILVEADGKTMDDLKATELQNKCWNNGIENLKTIKDLKLQMLKKFEDVDKLRESEMLQNTAGAEGEAHFVQQQKKKNGNGK